MTTVLLIIIALSLVIIVVALVILGLSAYRLYKTVRRIQAEVDPQVNEILAKQGAITERLGNIEENQIVINHRLEKISSAAAGLGVLTSEFTKAKSRLKGY
ncbi:MAG: hypothetical protein KKA32_10425 [Actinobacteria bacterium]|nr:hypothetical protein [Actinomycetota bacterium]